MGTKISNLKIKWIGQNGYILSDGKFEICIDPYLSDLVERLHDFKRMVKAPLAPQEAKSDVVICTHRHIDHVDTDAIPLMNKENMLFLAPQDAEEVLRECGVTNYKSFDCGDSITVGEFTFTAVFADHTVPAIGVVVKHGDVTLYFAGDTLYNEKLEDIKDFGIDISFICINGKLGNMNVEEAIKLTRIINPKVAVPTHYGMFANNTEDPVKYTSRLENAFEMEHNTEYDVSELINR